MKIGIDISQVAYGKTGVSEYLSRLVEKLLEIDKKNEYIPFFSSMRKKFRFPPTLLDFMWNRLHVFPIEWLIGPVDVFISSDWTQPPTRAKKATILYDLIVYKHPEETDKKIVEVQKRRLKWVKKECDAVLCISESTKKDAEEILGIESDKMTVVYPGV